MSVSEKQKTNLEDYIKYVIAHPGESRVKAQARFSVQSSTLATERPYVNKRFEEAGVPPRAPRSLSSYRPKSNNAMPALIQVPLSTPYSAPSRMAMVLGSPAEIAAFLKEAGL